jgi:hypothetical protein
MNALPNTTISGPQRASLRAHLRRIADRRMGRVQLQCWRCLVGLGRPVKIRDLLKWCYPKAIEFQPWHRTNVHRAIIRVARPVGKTRERHGTTWALRETKTQGEKTPKD